MSSWAASSAECEGEFMSSREASSAEREGEYMLEVAEFGGDVPGSQSRSSSLEEKVVSSKATAFSTRNWLVGIIVQLASHYLSLATRSCGPWLARTIALKTLRMAYTDVIKMTNGDWLKLG